MKEQQPINQDRLIPTQSGLTAQANTPKLEVRRDIFMPDGPGGGELPVPRIPRKLGSEPQAPGEIPKAPVTVLTEAVDIPEDNSLRRQNATERIKARMDPERIADVRKQWERVNAGRTLSLAERRTQEMLIERGVYPPVGGATTLNNLDYPDSRLLNIVAELNADIVVNGVGNPLEPHYVQEQRARVRNLLDQGLVDPAQANRLLGELNSWMREAQAAASSQERGGSIRLYLEPRDIEMLEKDPMNWLNSKFDMIYQFVDEGQELVSPQINQLQQMFTVGANYISTYATDLNKTPEEIKKFITEFNTRLNLIFMRSAIEHKNMESVKQAAERLQSHGLLTALGMEEGSVNVMFSRMGELLEDKRLAQDQLMRELVGTADLKKRGEIKDEANKLHVTPEMMSGLQKEVISEQLRGAVKGAGSYGEVYQKAIDGGKTPDEAGALVKSQIVRAVRTAYDVFVVSQRQAVIVARGHALTHVDAFKSDPASLFNMFNLEDLLTEKFGMFNKQANAFLDKIKIGIARSKLPNRGAGYTDEQLIAYGKRMFRDLFAAPDFFSSGWRQDHILEKIRENVAGRLGPDGKSLDEEDFALFIRLKKNPTDRPKTWKRIAEIRPEEIVRLYRERAVGDPVLEAQLSRFFEGDAFVGYRVDKVDARGNPVFKVDARGRPTREREVDGFATYDKFKKEFGAIVQLLRQNAYGKEFRTIRIGEVGPRGLSPDDIATITKYFDNDATKAGQLQRMFAKFMEFSKDDFGHRVEVYKKGDALPKGKEVEEGDTFIGKAKSGRGVIRELLDFDKFEDIYTRTLLVDDALLDILDRDSDTITPLSSTWKSEVAQDPLVRNFNDLDHYAKAAGALIGFVYKEDAKQRLEAAMTFAEEVSQYNGQGGRAECIRYTAGSFLGISKQSFFWDALGIGKLPFRKAMSDIEKIYGPQAQPMSRGDLRGRLDEIDTLLTSTAAKGDTPEDTARAIVNAGKYYRELEHLLEVTGEDTVKLRSLSLVFFLIFSAFVEGYVVLDLKSPGGK